MITFVCGGCGRSFTVPDGFAGRRASCKSCGAAVVVPAGQAPAAPLAEPAPPAKIPLRVRRLQSDARQMTAAFAGSQAIRLVDAKGDPPDLYRVEYRVIGLQAAKGKEPVRRDQHLVEIQLTSEYPRISPKCRMLTPVFHPNIDETTICVGDHWTAGERLAALVVRIGEMIAYQAYNIKSPLNAEAAMWADLNPRQFPLDPRNLHPPDL
jgi:ubiquitin-protein ligase